MRKRRKVKAINVGLQLPEPILHRIQSFLTAKEAAQTAILSKSWRSAWLTRPNLDLCLHDLGLDDDGDYKLEEFSELAMKTVQRYEQSNLKIESFRLWTSQWVDVDSGDLASDLIRRALKIGATHLNFRMFGRKIVLPQEVFEAENLVGLYLNGCKIDNLGFGQKVRCSKLETLSLWFVTISSEMISSIASCCPLIEKLLLYNLFSFNDDGLAYYSFLGDLSSRFPSLKELTLQECQTQEVSRVSSCSLERLNFATRGSRLSVKFDLPSICKFRFEGDDIPSLSFVSAPREWESDISIKDCDSGLSTLWLRRLNKFLTELSLSRIYLTLQLRYYERCKYEVGEIRGLPKPKVENLTIGMMGVQALTCFALFHGLFQICRPKFITLDYKLIYDETNLLCKTLARGLDDKCMYGLHDLEDVNVSLFDKDVNAWRPLPLNSFLDLSISPKGNQKTRFKLKWKT